jgi:hypothetical protein
MCMQRLADMICKLADTASINTISSAQNEWQARCVLTSLYKQIAGNIMQTGTRAKSRKGASYYLQQYFNLHIYITNRASVASCASLVGTGSGKAENNTAPPHPHPAHEHSFVKPRMIFARCEVVLQSASA